MFKAYLYCQLLFSFQIILEFLSGHLRLYKESPLLWVSLSQPFLCPLVPMTQASLPDTGNILPMPY